MKIIYFSALSIRECTYWLQFECATNLIVSLKKKVEVKIDIIICDLHDLCPSSTGMKSCILFGRKADSILSELKDRTE